VLHSTQFISHRPRAQRNYIEYNDERYRATSVTNTNSIAFIIIIIIIIKIVLGAHTQNIKTEIWEKTNKNTHTHTHT